MSAAKGELDDDASDFGRGGGTPDEGGDFCPDMNWWWLVESDME